MKTIAMYLPQFHQVDENDKWWGEGYTEWTAVKNAKPLFEGHYQPHVPLDGKYYDLMDKDTMKWQADIMKEYSIDGMCFYHYYFKNGKKILEKPAENLLKWKEIDMPFCFSWANESWIRTWSEIGGNTWNVNMEREEDDSNGVLLMQDYGGAKEWERHIEYLLPFFLDKRYISIEGRPVFIIYKPDDINCLNRMKECWNSKVRCYGIESIYFIGVNTRQEGFDGYLAQQPTHASIGVDKSVEKYENACEEIVEDAIIAENDYLCGLVSYDETPRKGEKGLALVDTDPYLFKEQLKRLFYLSELRNKEYLFINAWNEWGEGMHLEPDERYGLSFLEAVKEAKQEYKDIPHSEKERLSKKQVSCKTTDSDSMALKKYKSHYYLLNKWMILKEEKQSIVSYFKRNGIKSISLYGIGFLGKHFLKEIEESEVMVSYIIDKNAERYRDFNVIRPYDKCEKTDLLVVTPIDEYYEIVDTLCLDKKQRVISLEEIIDEIINEL